MKQNIDVLIIGAGAAGLFCAAQAGQRGRKVCVIDHANKPGKKILMSGGGKCNFTNRVVTHENYFSQNRHFTKSALAQYTPQDFLALVHSHKVKYEERRLGKLFCLDSAKPILNMLLKECDKAKADIHLKTSVDKISKTGDGFEVLTSRGTYICKSLVIATGGLSIPTMGATPFGYKVAEQFGMKVWPTRAALVPLTLHLHDKAKFEDLSGVSCDVRVTVNQKSFEEAMLFTHRGLSGPVILQASTFWGEGDWVTINFLPEFDWDNEIEIHRDKNLKNFLGLYLPKRLVETLMNERHLNTAIKSLPKKVLNQIKESLFAFRIQPCGTEGYRTAEVTMGGVDCNAISSKTMMAKDVPGLFFIGEVLDVTGQLGGYNFQWAWSSAYAAGQVV